MKIKTRFDQPHLEPLRYDYQLLRDATKDIRRSLVRDTLESCAFMLAIVLVLGFLGFEIYRAVDFIGNPWREIAEEIRRAVQ